MSYIRTNEWLKFEFQFSENREKVFPLYTLIKECIPFHIINEYSHYVKDVVMAIIIDSMQINGFLSHRVQRVNNLSLAGIVV